MDGVCGGIIEFFQSHFEEGRHVFRCHRFLPSQAVHWKPVGRAGKFADPKFVVKCGPFV